MDGSNFLANAMQGQGMLATYISTRSTIYLGQSKCYNDGNTSLRKFVFEVYLLLLLEFGGTISDRSALASALFGELRNLDVRFIDENDNHLHFEDGNGQPIENNIKKVLQFLRNLINHQARKWFAQHQMHMQMHPHQVAHQQPYYPHPYYLQQPVVYPPQAHPPQMHLMQIGRHQQPHVHMMPHPTQQQQPPQFIIHNHYHYNDGNGVSGGSVYNDGNGASGGSVYNDDGNGASGGSVYNDDGNGALGGSVYNAPIDSLGGDTFLGGFEWS